MGTLCDEAVSMGSPAVAGVADGRMGMVLGRFEVCVYARVSLAKGSLLKGSWTEAIDMQSLQQSALHGRLSLPNRKDSESTAQRPERW